jgi:23S rRNA-intervening sequence protein
LPSGRTRLWSFVFGRSQEIRVDDPSWLPITYNLPEEAPESLCGGLYVDIVVSDLRVWQEAMKLTAEIYRGTVGFPRHELYGLSSQMRRAASPYQVILLRAQGHHSDKEFSHFLLHARGSLLELQTQL